ncbi:MAG: acetate--CoA ligase [Kiritimatiellia bacterium]|jgi:acetyl-CoA synthetase|nr:acetate--CoA ligase [Kiritimatiellia bacterium]MDP6631665.1 acetate--CoA ligase [Kiritimatiellia bacterium]MDP6810763.1 acetate--CoA ligase [Kiritimatiellia bacterium]MDP7022638.1 acetate--CoA ligase [Kiritimatiellia bacterium]
MSEEITAPVGNSYPPPADFAAAAHVSSEEQYNEMYQRSITDPEGFWGEIADQFVWKEKWSKVLDYTFEGNVDVKWFIDGKTNLSVNCLDRHLEERGDKTAIIWEGNTPGVDSTLTYRELYEKVCKFANALRAAGVQKGDRVCLYLQMIPEAAIACLACARIGAIHSVVFGAFSPDALRDRINDSACKILITQDTALRGPKDNIPMKANADKALADCPSIETCFVVKRTGLEVAMQDGRDVWYEEAVADQPAECEPEWVDSEDPLFILYTSGSTGKPKGVLHTTGGYMVYAATTFKNIFDIHEEDIWWCTADIGWITGHSYIVYGPLATGATSIMFEGVPTYPDAGRFWDVCDKYKVTQFYTAPTAVRALMQKGEEPIAARDLSTLKLLGSVGEPINPNVWNWYRDHVGHGTTPVVDTWWQTETGGIMITPLPGAHTLKPGSASRPFFGIEPVILDDDGKEVPQGEKGKLCIKKPWPGILRSLYGDHDRMIQTYFSTYKGYYFTGDGCRIDEDGDYWLLGRVDDVINVSGHRMGTAEVESALVSNPAVAEAAVVGFPHPIKGQGIYAYVTLKTGNEYTDELKSVLVKHVRTEIGPIAAPDMIQWAPALPKTRSGKIMRRILRKIAEGEADSIGDVSTLADPSVVEHLVAEYKPLG